MTHFIRHRASFARKFVARAAVACAFASALSACTNSSTDDGKNEITIGLLLPFTGASSGTASNFERAALYAADRVNDGGGIYGKKIRILSADTHSDVASAQSSAELLVRSGAVAVVGPESADIAAEIGPYLSAQGVAFVSPVVGAADDTTVDCSSPWFRLAPSAQALGESLAKQAIAEGVSSITLMYASTAYDEALRDALSARFISLKGTVKLTVALDPNAQSYGKEVDAAQSANADAIVLTSSPRGGAIVVNEFDALSEITPRWFLCPQLKTDLLVQNVAPDALEGARGVAPKIYDTTTDFPLAFGQRWQGDTPLEGAFFYYDSIALLAFGLTRAEAGVMADGGAPLDLNALNAGIRAAAAPPGEAAGWNEIERGLSRGQTGTSIYYSGLTGPLLFNTCGVRALGSTSTWEVSGGRIIDDAD